LASRHFADWLAAERVSLALSTYQSGKLFLVGLGDEGRLSVFERTFNRSMGLWSDGQTLWLASAYQLWRLENTLTDGEREQGYDRLYVPRVGYTTGDVDAHDVAVDAQGRVIFVSTSFSCLATVSDRYSFAPLWQPAFISRLAAEDRCHLNGLAMADGRPRYVTACSSSDVADGWRDRRHDGGCVIDVESNEVVAAGLSMPHSPRLDRDRLWALDSGRGDFGYVDLASGRFEPVTFCPGFARGLAFVGDYALVGVSKPRREQTFTGLALDEKLAAKNAAARCGVQVVDLRSGDVVHWLRLEGVVEELYDVVALPGVARPKALGFKTDEIRYNVWLPVDGKPVRWSGQTKT
jgi:uncharacterized protein (TIGR03032 family)